MGIVGRETGGAETDDASRPRFTLTGDGLLNVGPGLLNVGGGATVRGGLMLPAAGARTTGDDGVAKDGVRGDETPLDDPDREGIGALW